MDGVETRRFIAKLILFAFGGYLFFTYIQRNTPSGKFSEMGVFIFTFFLNFGTCWWIYMLQGLAGTIMQYLLIFIQLGFFAWTVYDFRFVYYAHMARDYETFLYTPLLQYGCIFPLFLVLLMAKTREQ